MALDALSSEPFYIELVGLPGAGKSTMANSLTSRLDGSNIRYSNPIARVNDMPALRRIPTKFGYSVLYSLSHPIWSSRSIISLQLPDLVTSPETRSVALNWLFVNGVRQWSRYASDMVILDQGPLQAYWSALLSEDPRFRRVFDLILEEQYRSGRTLLVEVTASPDILRRRLAEREPRASRIRPDLAEGYTLERGLRAFSELRNRIELLIEDGYPITHISIRNETLTDLDRNVDCILNNTPIG